MAEHLATPATNDRHKRRPVASAPTVVDVARIAGVSPMTVSRVVNKVSSVSSEAREKVLSAVAELGYVPNAAARILAGGKQYRVTLLHSNPSAAYLSEFLMGSLDQAAQTDLLLMVEHVSNADPAALAARLVQHRTDAVLLPPPLCDDLAVIAALRAAGLPIARIATGLPMADIIAVTIDDEAAARTMTAHLLGLGHRRIGFISGDSNQSASALRRRGYDLALAGAGIEPDPQLVAVGDFSYRSGLSAAEQLLSLRERPTAIFASNDDMAAATVATAHRHGIDIPRDLSVCGFDDSATATMIWPELTTIRQPIMEMAQIATRLLGEEIRGGTTDGRVERLDFELIRRGTDGPPVR